MEDSHTQWILTAPVLISMVASTIFLVNVVHILLTKLHSASANPAPLSMRKAVRATLILVPLFGIHHILIPFRPEPGQAGEKIYQVFSAVVVSLQVRMLVNYKLMGLASPHLLWLCAVTCLSNQIHKLNPLKPKLAKLILNCKENTTLHHYIDQLLFKEIIAVYTVNYTKPVNTKCSITYC
jgi:hypothetical protein